jgi:1-acyl-sn-glycerol-3-phosphate acyltransferase
MWYSALKWFIRSGLYAYHTRIQVHGLEHVPTEKPVLFLPNHQSALMDVLLVAIDCRRKPYFLTRSDVFGKPLLNAFFKFLRMVPIYRIRDGRDTLHKNDAIFDTCAELLNRGEAIVMFPEANHNLKRRVRPLSKGFTRVLFRALEENPTLDIQLVPVGLNYQQADAFPDAVALHYGKPISVLELYQQEDVQNSVRNIKEAVSQGLKGLTTHIAPERHYEALHAYLEEQNVDFLQPKATNALVQDWNKGHLRPKPKKAQTKGQNLFYPLFLVLNLPVILLWKGLVKPKVWEPEFMGTLRFATALGGYLLCFGFLFALFTWWLGLFFAIALVGALFLFNWAYVKINRWPSKG